MSLGFPGMHVATNVRGPTVPWREIVHGRNLEPVAWLNEIFPTAGGIVPLFVRHGDNEAWTNKYELVVDIGGEICGRGAMGRRPHAELGCKGFLDACELARTGDAEQREMYMRDMAFIFAQTCAYMRRRTGAAAGIWPERDGKACDEVERVLQTCLDFRDAKGDEFTFQVALPGASLRDIVFQRVREAVEQVEPISPRINGQPSTDPGARVLATNSAVHGKKAIVLVTAYEIARRVAERISSPASFT
jgi:hypothetical protein